MASADALDDDRDSSLPASALSPAEYRSFRAFLLELHHAAGNSLDKLAPLDAVIAFLTSFHAVNHTVAQQVRLPRVWANVQICDCVVGRDEGESVEDGKVYAMIRLVGHWQSEGRIERDMIFVQCMLPCLSCHMALTCDSTRSRPDSLKQNY
jgi:hypothetical protein